MLTVLSLVIVLGVLVFVHELGHFLAAKWAGIRVFRFSVGMGAPIRWLTWTRNGTEYTVSWLPLGGYVKMASHEEMAGDALEGGAPEEAVPVEETFEAKPVWKRMVVILAGVTFNLVFAWLVFTGLFVKNGQPFNPTTTVGRVIDSLVPADAAALRTVRPGDRITAVNGEEVASWEAVVEGIQSAPGDTVVLGFADREDVILAIHHDALEDRLRAGLALLPELPAVVGQVMDGTPAQQAGLAVGDTVVGLDTLPIGQWYDMVELVEARAGVPMVLTVGRPAGRMEIAITPRTDTLTLADGATRTVGRIGVLPAGPLTQYRPLSLGAAMVAGGQSTAATSTFIVRSVRGLFTGRVALSEVGGPIAIGQSAAQSARAGVAEFLTFMALISVNLAVVNLLPIPVLDGGQFLFLLAEAVIRRPLPLRLRQALTGVGLFLLVLLMVLAFGNDIRRLFGF